MAKCKVCKTNIPDGLTYCEVCKDKMNQKSNESYLDSLLSSVKNTASDTENIYKKKNTTLNIDSSMKEPVEAEEAELDLLSEEAYEVEEAEEAELEILPEEPKEAEDNRLDDVKEITDDFLPEKSEESNGSVDIDIKSEKEYTNEDLDMADEPNEVNEMEHDYDVSISDDIEEFVNFELNGDFKGDINISDSELFGSDIDDIFADGNSAVKDEYHNILQDEISDYEDGTMDQDLDYLINELDDDKKEIEDVLSEDDPLPIKDEAVSVKEEETEIDSTVDDDLLSLLNQIEDDDPIAEDVMAINNMLNGTYSEEESASLDDVGEVFTDALKVVTSLEDPEAEAEELDTAEKPDNRKLKKKKKREILNELDNKIETIEEEKTEKIGLLQRLFGNKKDGTNTKSTDIIGQSNNDAIAAAGDLSEEKKNNKKKKGNKKDKNEKGKNKEQATDNSSNETLENETSDKAKKAVKNEKQKEKKEKKKVKEIVTEMDEPDDDGKINRVGASIVFAFFGIILVFLLLGTNWFTYSISIENAEKYYNKQKYTEAYNEIYGLEIKDKDKDIYNKIMTIMFVRKQFESYENYYSINKYPEALDSLLKGLDKYNKYKVLASLYGIEEDLDIVRDEILYELDQVFHLKEEDALEIISEENELEYSKQVYDIVN